MIYNATVILRPTHHSTYAHTVSQQLVKSLAATFVFLCFLKLRPLHHKNTPQTKVAGLMTSSRGACLGEVAPTFPRRHSFFNICTCCQRIHQNKCTRHGLPTSTPWHGCFREDSHDLQMVIHVLYIAAEFFLTLLVALGYKIAENGKRLGGLREVDCFLPHWLPHVRWTFSPRKQCGEFET